MIFVTPRSPSKPEFTASANETDVDAEDTRVQRPRVMRMREGSNAFCRASVGVSLRLRR